MTLQEAKEWVIKKWKYIVDNNGSDDELYEKYPELKRFPSGCTYCELFWENNGECKKCPININGITCYNIKHPWNIWHINKSKGNAQKVIQNKTISNQNMSINAIQAKKIKALEQARDELIKNLSNINYVKSLTCNQYIRKQNELNDLIYKCEFKKQLKNKV